VATSLDATSAPPSYRWAVKGDINAFFGLMLDNIGVMILLGSLLVGVYGFPREFVLTRMVPGTAVGVLVGDLIYTAMAFRLAKRSGRADVTAMPLGLDTPSTFGVAFLIVGPAFQAATARGLDPLSAARHAWFIGIAMLLASGLFKLACAVVSGAVRGNVPRAGLLGSLAAIALVLISFLPLLDIAARPVAGLVALALLLTALTARWELPGRVPGALAAVVVGCLISYTMSRLGLEPDLGAEGARPGPLRAVLPIPVLEWLAWFQTFGREAMGYLPVAIPLALATVVGGIDCAESAAAAGDDYPTGSIIAAEGLSTLVAGLFGGVIQSTPYIGHPAYKTMGARAGYTLATALFVGAAGVFGYFAWIFFLIPKAVVFPILIFVGLEITAQSFHATPRRHYPALALACVPALAYLALIPLNSLLAESGKPFDAFRPQVQGTIQTLTMLSNGFIVTSLLWATGLARIIDGRMQAAAVTFALAGVFALFGIIHSPLPSAEVLWPGDALRKLAVLHRAAASAAQTPYHWAAAYWAMAAVLLVIGKTGLPPTSPAAHTEPDAPSPLKQPEGSNLPRRAAE
jgi:AGZA family xanthine/uracil permease-like MFS transporter